MNRLKSVRRVALLAVASGLAAMAAPQIASAGPSAGQTFQVRATVPLSCWVRPSGALLADEGRMGSVVEACNSPGGFTVSAQYRPLVGAEKARITYGERSLNLSKNGSVELRRSNMASIRAVNYRFEDVELEQPLILALTIQPI